MGVVYAASDRDLDRRVALKLVRDQKSKAASRRLLREAQALGHLSHPNVVAVRRRHPLRSGLPGHGAGARPHPVHLARRGAAIQTPRDGRVRARRRGARRGPRRGHRAPRLQAGQRPHRRHRPRATRSSPCQSAPGLIYQTRKEYREALPWFERSLAVKEMIHGRDHPDGASVVFNLAYTLMRMKQCARSIALYQRALAMHRKAGGADHPDAAQVLAGLGEAHLLAGKPRRALPPLERAVDLYGRSEGRVAEAARSQYLLARRYGRRDARGRVRSGWPSRPAPASRGRATRRKPPWSPPGPRAASAPSAGRAVSRAACDRPRPGARPARSRPTRRSAPRGSPGRPP